MVIGVLRTSLRALARGSWWQRLGRPGFHKNHAEWKRSSIPERPCGAVQSVWNDVEEDNQATDADSYIPSAHADGV